MKVKGVNGRTYSVKVQSYLVNWDRKVSGPQKRVKDFLRPYWDRVGIVVTEECAIPTGSGRPMRVDLINWNRRIVIEVSPASSHSFNRFFHKTRVGFGAAVGRDLHKAEWAEANGFTYVALDEKDIEQLSPGWFSTTHGIVL